MNTTYFLNCVAGNLFQIPSAAPLPAHYYLGLSTTAPSLDGGNIQEPATSAGYARIKLESFSVPVDGEVTNTATILFEESTADWGVISHFTIFDSPTVGQGNLLIFGELPIKHDIKATSTMMIKPGALKLRIANPA